MRSSSTNRRRFNSQSHVGGLRRRHAMLDCREINREAAMTLRPAFLHRAGCWRSAVADRTAAKLSGRPVRIIVAGRRRGTDIVAP